MFTAAEMPPAFEGQAWLFLATLFAQITMFLLSLDWAWRIVLSMFTHPTGLRAPLTVRRVVIISLTMSLAMTVGGDLFYNMRFADLSPAGRVTVREADAALDVAALWPLTIAWLVDRLAGGMIAFQLERTPFPLHLWPTWSQMKRPLKIGVGVFVLSFTLTFLR